MNIKKKISNRLPLLLSTKIKKDKILVIESDDWGSVRTSSKQSYSTLLNKGYPVDKNPYVKNDSLERNVDIEGLANLLLEVRNSHNQHPIITLNNVVGNPNFEMIKKGNYKTYYNEPFYKTYDRYSSCDKSFGLLKDGVNDGLFYPQFHGREHVNVKRWMNSLQNQEQHSLDAFEEEMFSVPWSNNRSYPNEYLDSFDFDSKEQFYEQEEIFKEGFDLFQDIWGFKSQSFIANCYIWHPELEKLAYDVGVKYFQGLVNQFIPSDKGYRKKYHYTGQKSKAGITYLVRNAFFEPTSYPHLDWIDETLYRINLAFKFNVPAILSTHRVNFIGALSERNRTENLKTFEIILKKVVKTWPEVRFMHSSDLGNILKEN